MLSSAAPSLFETPYPNLKAQEQAYRIPSSRPRPSSTPFSPVPMGKRNTQRYKRAPTSTDLRESMKNNTGMSQHDSYVLLHNICGPNKLN